jgi:hypothetical protein
MNTNVPGEGDLFTAKPTQLSGLLTGIDEHAIALPNFQRPWVWEPQMVNDLIVSVAHRYPAGSLLTMPPNKGFALRPFERSGEKLKQKPTLMILDGQQRLTSLYQALFRDDGVHFESGPYSLRGTYFFYLDIAVLLSDPDGNIDEGDPLFDKALFYVREKNGKRLRYISLQNVVDLTTEKDELKAGALPLRYTADPDGRLAHWKEEYLDQNSETKAEYMELSRTWDKLVRPWLDRIRRYPFPVVELTADMPLSAICHIFEKVNSTGKPLDVFDLVNAILWAQGFHLNERWEATRKTLKSEQMLQMQPQPLSGTAFLQGLSLLDSLDRKRSDPEGRIAVACRKQDLMSLMSERLERWWDILVDGYRAASRFMSGRGIIAEKILPYSTLLIPLSAIFADLLYRKGEAQTKFASAKIERWYWCSVFSQRYSSQTEYVSAQDFEQVVAWVEGGDEPDVVRTFGFRSDYLQEVTSIRNAIYKGILCLLAKDGAWDFSGGERLSTELFYSRYVDHHHIFPTAAIKHLGIDDARADTIVNKTLINYAVNRSIGGSKPSVYLEKLRGNLGAAKLDAALRSHAIDPTHLANDDWQGYILDRREKLRQMILAACGGNVQPFSDELEIEEPDED